MTRLDPQMKIRLPDDLKRAIEEQAKIGGRSMNAEIISRLTQSFESSPVAAALQQELQHLQARIAGHQKLDAISSGTTEALAGYVVRLHEHLPPKVQQELNTAIAYRLALALLKKDGAGLADVFGDLFADDLSVVEEMHRLKSEFSSGSDAPAKNARQQMIPVVGTVGQNEKPAAKKNSKKGP